MKRAAKGRGVFYSRDSAGKHEMTPGEYVAWAQRESKKLKVSFSGTPETIEAMIRDGSSERGDIFFDFGVKGNIMSRPGLDAMRDRIRGDTEVTHVFIPRRDRLARPDNAIDGICLEDSLREQGLTLVYMDIVLEPLVRGAKRNVAELIVAAVDFDQSGSVRWELATKMIFAQIRLAKLGFSTGGRPPYGFRRHLVSADGTPVRELAEGERVRMQGHHVIWLPGPDEELALIRRILDMLLITPASRVAATLTSEGILSPDAGRYRTDNGVRHQVSGTWSQSTINNIARNPLLRAVTTYGRRSMGDKLRFTPEGPRELTDDEFRDDNKVSVVRNPPEQHISASARFEPIVPIEDHDRLIEILDRRAGTQRGKPRSREPSKNPLGSRIFDINCTWPMYRTPYSGSYKYKCGLYQQSHGQRCDHNTVDGPSATQFMLSNLRQRLPSPMLKAKLEQRLRRLAAQELSSSKSIHDLTAKKNELSRLAAELDTISKNMALAKSPARFKVVAAVFDETKGRHAALSVEMAKAKDVTDGKIDVEAEISRALGLIGRLTDLMDRGGDDPGLAREVFDLTNARLFLRFRPRKVKNRVLNKIAGGVVTFGTAPPPVDIYTGPTGRGKIKGSVTQCDTEPSGCSSSKQPECVDSGEEGDSLGNVSRGDWTPVELFSAGVASWPASVCGLVVSGA